MQTKLKKMIAVVLVLVLVGSLLGCATQQPAASGDANAPAASQAPSNNNTSTNADPGASETSARSDVIYGLTSDPSSFDPSYTTEQISVITHRQMYDTLVVVDQNGEFKGKLAESWEISEDGKTYTFYLRKDVICHDGQPMTAEDVAFSLNKIIQAPATGGSMTNMIDCTVVDDYTVEIHLTGPYEATLYVLESMGRIFSKNCTDFDTNPIGTGPYKYVSRSSGENVIMEAWDQYYLGEPAIKNLTFKVITDTTTQVAALQMGEIDFLTHAPLEAKNTVEGDSSLVWQETQHRGNIWVSMNHTVKPFDNILVRKAVQAAVDKEAILVGGSDGRGQTLKTLWISTCNASPEDVYEPPYQYDPEAAKGYLQQYMQEEGVDKVEITILAPDTTMYLNPATVLEGLLRDVGFTVTTEQIDRGTFWASVISGAFEIAVVGGSYPLNDADMNYMFFHSTGGQNHTQIGYPELDAAMELGRNSMDKEERIQAYAQAQKVIDENAMVVTLLQPNNAVAYSANLKGVDKFNNLYQNYVFDWSW